MRIELNIDYDGRKKKQEILTKLEKKNGMIKNAQIKYLGESKQIILNKEELKSHNLYLMGPKLFLNL